jgi:hypothetical protein
MVLFENVKVFSAFPCVGRIQMMDSCKSFTASFYFTDLNYLYFKNTRLMRYSERLHTELVWYLNAQNLLYC